MDIKSIQSTRVSNSISDLPKSSLPEYAFTGRSNVGKSSLINYFCNKKSLAPTSNKPGKTKSIHHYLINEKWYIVDLPGYGYAKTSKKNKRQWTKLMEDYLLNRASLSCVFHLLDIRREIQSSDMDFMEFCGLNEIPIAIIFTKYDKLNSTDKKKYHIQLTEHLRKIWEPLPPTFITSSTEKIGKKEVMEFISKVNTEVKGH